MAVLGGLVALAAAWSVMRDLPLADILPPLEEPTLTIATADGQRLTPRGTYRAAYAPLADFPPHLVDAVLAIEDRRFREHAGVDLLGIGRALLRNADVGAAVEGGSTITQQLVKILYLDPDRTLRRKFQEVALATALERQLGKDRILEMYLNSVYLGSGAFGMPAAARTYFGKEVGELTLPESALLAASIQLPSQVNPLSDLGAAQNRAALALSLMSDQGRIAVAERDQATARLAAVSPVPPAARGGSYFGDWVLREVEGLGGAAADGMEAEATLDQALQTEAERIVREVMEQQGAAAGATQAALVAMTPDGRVRAMVGGLDYEASQFNRATDALRQPGSTFKLFVYLAALVMGATTDRVLSDEPIEIDGWTPQNFDGRSGGDLTLAQAFAGSHNIATVRLAQEVGIDNIIAVARQFGIEGDLAATPALALGTSEVTLIDLTEAYAAMALGRAPVKATGLSVLRFEEEGAALSVAGAEAAEQVRLTRTWEPMLGLLRSVVTDGTGRAANIEGVLAGGKTGTSQDSRDAWFVGFTDNLVIGVWVGNDDNSPMRSVTGGGIPAEIWRRVMAAAVFGPALETDPAAQPGSAVDPAAPASAPAEPAAGSAAGAGPQCNVAACSAAYFTFDASDCTYQPRSGPRRLCTR